MQKPAVEIIRILETKRFYSPPLKGTLPAGQVSKPSVGCGEFACLNGKEVSG